MKTLLPLLIEAAIPLVAAFITWLFATLATELRARVKSARLRDVLLRASEQARDVVLELEQTEAQALRDSAKDGKLTAEEVASLKQLALDKLKGHIGPKGKAELLAVLGFKSEAELEQVLRSKLEAELLKVKTTIGSRLKAVTGVAQ